MKALELLYRYKKANEDMGNFEAINIYEAIKELEEIVKELQWYRNQEKIRREINESM